MRQLALLILAPLVACPNAHAGNSITLPSATVTEVTATSPVLRSTSEIIVSASVIPTFDGSSGPATAQQSCTACNNGNNYCGSGLSTVRSQQILTTTTVTVENRLMTVRVAPEFGARNPTISVMTSEGGVPGSAGTYTGVLPPQVTADDGIHTVTVTAYLSEDVTTTTAVATNWMSAGSCGGQVMKSVANAPISSTVPKYGTGSAMGSYVLDINPPTLTLKPVTSQRQVQQGGNKVIHNVLSAGSALTPYTLINTAIGPTPSVVSARGGDQFGPSKTGIAADKHDMVSIHIPCDCSVGDYSVDPVSTTANTVDLALNPFPPISSSAAESFHVEPGQSLMTQTLVVAELPPNGDYAEMACFESTLGGPQGSRVNTSPGSLHITATVKTAGPCAGFGYITNPRISLTLPIGFEFAESGASPAAHVFVGPSSPGFDLHSPQTLVEVTGMIPKAVPDGQTVTVDLSTLNVGGGPGAIPSSYTIYVRAHGRPVLSAVPPDGTQYYFNTRVTAGLPGIADHVTVRQDQTVTATAACAGVN